MPTINWLHAMQLHRPGAPVFARVRICTGGGWFVLCLFFGVGNPQNMVFFSLLVLLGLAVGFFTIPLNRSLCAAGHSRFTIMPGNV